VILSKIVWNACAQPGTCADFGEDSTSRMVGRKVFSLPVESKSAVVDFDMVLARSNIAPAAIGYPHRSFKG
jgi:hypothetical protein